MKKGDRVKLVKLADDFRYPLTLGAVGTIAGGPYIIDDDRTWYWVEWDDAPDEAAMRHWPDELAPI